MINLYYGSIVNPKTLVHYDAFPRCLIAVGNDGNIIWMEDNIEASVVHNTIRSRVLEDEYTVVDFSSKSGEFMMPGLIDTHIHACQFPNMGIGGDRELLDWIIEYALPIEAKFKDKKYAERTYNDAIDRSIACGTTTSCYYGTSHLDATMILADIVHKKGQRAFVGTYSVRKTTEVSIEDVTKFIKHVQALHNSHTNSPLVHPIITPKLTQSCSNELLTELGKLAARFPNVSIQAHIAEDRKESESSIRRYGAKCYAEIYDKFGLLRNNTILGHGIWLTEKDMKLIAEHGAGVAHCPTSNFHLSSGMAKIGSLLDHGIKVGLGTDVSGGYNPSILYTIQMASATSKMVAVQAELDQERRQKQRTQKCCEHGKHCNDACDRFDESSDMVLEAETETVCDDHTPTHGYPPFTNQKFHIETLLYLATLGGAHVCCLQDRIGSFEVGKAFDALYVSLDDVWDNPVVWGKGVDETEMENTEKNLRKWLERFLFGGDNRNVRKVFVQGIMIGGADKDVRMNSGPGSRVESEV